MDRSDASHVTGKDGLLNSWSTLGDSPTREEQEPAEPIPADSEDFDFESYLNASSEQFVNPQSLELNKDKTADGPSYDELMGIDFTQNIDYSAKPTVSNLPAQPSLVSDPVLPSFEYQQGTDLNNVQVSAHLSIAYVPTAANNFMEPAPLPTISTTEAPSLQGLVGRYRNDILNSFTDPSTPLKVIDDVKYPFEQVLQAALEQELRRQQAICSFEARHQVAEANNLSRRTQEDQYTEKDFEAYLSSLVATAPAPTPAPAQDDEADSKKHGNKRPLNIRKFNPTEFYEPLTTRPESWGSINPKTNMPLFQYTVYGELNPLSTFSTNHIIEYIGQHPLHSVSKSKKESRLTLWIQTVPADSERRYPNRNSNRCRFADCPDRHRTIRKGDFRVAFDEQSSQSLSTDPFHNAGYVHLFCLEKYLDFPQICKDFNVQPDVRLLREGKNKMAITRDHPSMEAIVRTFIVESLPWEKFGDGNRPKDYYPYTLNYWLTKEHLDKQPKHLQRIRETRGGNTIDRHMNNLEEYAENQRAIREEKQDERYKRAKEGAKKRKRAEKEEEDKMKSESSGEDILDKEILQRGLGSSRASKRMRR